MASESRARTAVILGLIPHPRSIAVIRSLGRIGIDMIGFDHEVPPHLSRTRYLKPEACHILDSPEAVVQALLNGAAPAGSVLIPTSDEYLLLISQYHGELNERYVLTCPAWAKLRQVMNIKSCYDLARACGIATPDYYQPKNENDLDHIISALDCPQRDYIVRTMPGTGPANAATHRFTKVAGSTPQAIRETCFEIHRRVGVFPTIVEVVPGEADSCLGVSLVADQNSDPMTAYCVRRLRLYTYVRDLCRTPGAITHPYELGSLVYCESHHDQEAMDQAVQLVKASGFQGAITVEFRRNRVDGKLMLIKCDPRVVRATSLSTALGLDIPSALYHTYAKTQDFEAPKAYRDGIAWMWISQFVEALWDNRQDLSVRQELLMLFRKIFNIRSFAFLSIRDPLPFFTHLAWRFRCRWNTRRRVRGRGTQTITP